MTEIAVLPVVLPAVWARLIHAKTLLEREFGDMQEFEFAVEEGEIYFLQSRAGRRTPRAAFRIASDLLDASLIDTTAAAERTSSLDTDRLVHRTLSPGPENVVVGLAMPAGEGVAIGRLVFDAERAQRLALEGPVVLARNDLNTDDFAGLSRPRASSRRSETGRRAEPSSRVGWENPVWSDAPTCAST